MRVMQMRANCRNRRKRLGDRIGRCGVDVDGLLTSAIGFGLIVFGLIEAPTLSWWTKKDNLQIGGWSWPEQWPISPVPLAIGVGLVFIGLFIRWELHRARNGRDALLDLNLFKVGTFSWGNLTAATVAISEFSLMFVLPLFFVNSVGLSTLLTGLVLAAMALGAFASGAAARLTAPGVVVLGLGLASAQLTSTVLGGIPPEMSGAGSATQSTVRHRRFGPRRRDDALDLAGARRHRRGALAASRRRA